ncbi:MAG TPA: ATP-dependent DNA helicase RecG [Thiobacillaceae bacterium]|nr:ATP-dependent DNA helicase RecG [Thiobacillaceae bacterium]HNU64106.1 ATP-dependent DNA helicase RecG [Thiobacillaceae bacterium]
MARKLGYHAPGELALHLPLRYEDETRLTPLHALRAGDIAQVEGCIAHAQIQPRPRRQLVLEVREAEPRSHPAEDGRTGLFCRLIHFYPNQVEQLKPGVRVRLFGEVRAGFLGHEMVHPRLRVVQPGTPLPTSLTPVYPGVAGLSQNVIRQAVRATLAQIDLTESLPQDLLRHLRLPGFAQVLWQLHAPSPDAPLDLAKRHAPGWRRLKFDELLAQQLSLRLAARQRHALCAQALTQDGGLGERLLALLPFSLTPAQHRVLEEIRRDLARPHPMNRLLQGDVGSGKTLVAALAVLPALAAGTQAAVMAPTEILAEQLYRKLHEWLTPLGLRVAWLTAALKGRARRQTLVDIATGRVHVAVGTQALFQAGVIFHNLSLAVVDEQHRFGVEQRLALREKGHGADGLTPHLLMLSATPIPRSLAMSYYADLDVSVIDALPPGRTPVRTRVMSLDRRDEVIARLRDYCLGGAQAYWVCPLVEESEKLQLKAAEASHAELTAALPELAIGLVHGRMKQAEKAAVMAAFKAGKLHLLVATTVIEVGVDVPNAALMVIEHAERYGLAQLHQLRGRVGRGARESNCLLLYGGPLSDAARQRLHIIKENTDGFAIAREDLRLRGPGEFLGARQSGLPMLRFADLEEDLDLLQAARGAAEDLLAQRSDAVHRHLERWLPRGLDYFRA